MDHSPIEDLQKILVSEKQIHKRISELGKEIEAFYHGDEVVIIAIINGAIVFVADLIRQIRLPVKLDCIRVSSYRDSTKPQGRPDIIDRLRLQIKG